MLARADIVKAVKDRIYNSGLGEKPSIRTGAIDTAAVTGDTVAFALATGQGAKVKAGQVLSSYGSADVADAYGFYILTVTGDELTCVNGYDGAAIADAAATPLLFEHQAKTTEYTIQKSIDDIIDSYLYPEVFDIFIDTFTPDFSNLQADANALDLRVIRGWQSIGGTVYQVPIKLIDNVSTTHFASGKMLTYDVVTSIDVEYSVVRRVTIANSTLASLEGLIAKGAAALCVEGVEEAVSDEEGGPTSRPLWGSFYNAKRQFETSLAKESVTSFKIDRG